MNRIDRRTFLRRLGVSTAVAPFVGALPSFTRAATAPRKQRLVVMFSPNGIVPPQFWPETDGDNFGFKAILAPLEPFKSKTLILQGVSNKVRGDGDSHMRGMSCLLTGIELFPGNIQ